MKFVDPTHDRQIAVRDRPRQVVIVAILLFGSSVVIGAIGAVLGFVVGILALFFGLYWLSTAFNISVEDMALYTCLTILPIAVIAGLMEMGKQPAVKLPASRDLATDVRERRSRQGRYLP